MFHQIIKERADSLLDRIPGLERALDGAGALDPALVSVMNDFSGAFREFRTLEKLVGPPVRSTGTEMAVREVVLRLERMEQAWRKLADRELMGRETAADPVRDHDRIGFGCAAGKRLRDLKVSDWVAPELLSVFSDANGGRLGRLDLFCGGADPASLAAPYLSPDWTADADDAYYALNLDIGDPAPAGRRTARHLIVIDRLETLRECLGAICREEILPSEYEFSLAFTAVQEGRRHHVHLDAISTGSTLDPLGLSRKKGATSATFRRFVDILASFYPGVISTCAASPVTEHWFKKYFNAVLLNAETENLFYGVIPPPGN